MSRPPSPNPQLQHQSTTTLKAYQSSILADKSNILKTGCSILKIEAHLATSSPTRFAEIVTENIACLCEMTLQRLREGNQLTTLHHLLRLMLLFFLDGSNPSTSSLGSKPTANWTTTSTSNASSVHAKVVTADVISLLVGGLCRVNTLGISQSAAISKAGQTGTSGTQSSSLLEGEVRTASLFLLATLINIFPAATYKEWELMFPECDFRDAKMRHPVLTPLLHDYSSMRARCGANSVIMAMMQKGFSQLQLATEPLKRSNSGKQQSAATFGAMSSKLFSILNALHQCMLYASARDEPCIGKLQPSKATYFQAASFVVGATPYPQCPSLSKLAISLFRSDAFLKLFHGERFEIGASLHYLSAVLRNKGLTASIAELSAPSPSPSSGVGKNSKNFKHDSTSSSANSGGFSLSKIIEIVVSFLPQTDAMKCLTSGARQHSTLILPYWSSIMNAVKVFFEKKSVENESCPHKDVMLETLRFVLQFMGSAWESFIVLDEGGDEGAKKGDDSFMLRETPGPKAPPEDLQVAFLTCVVPAMKCPSPEVRALAYKCIGHYRDDLFVQLPEATRNDIVTHFFNIGVREKIMEVREEAIGVLAIWGWLHPSLSEFYLQFAEMVCSCISKETSVTCLTKAANGLSTLTAKLKYQKEISILHVHMILDAAIRLCSKVQSNETMSLISHGYRTLGFILTALSEDDLIMECAASQEGITNFILLTLSDALKSHHDLTTMKSRWNAVMALGECLHRREVFLADPCAARQSLQSLLKCIQDDKSFKVRTRAALALTKIPLDLFVDMHPLCLDILAVAFESAKNTENFTQYKEQDPLSKQLREALSVFVIAYLPVEKAPAEIMVVMERHRNLLAQEELILLPNSSSPGIRNVTEESSEAE